MIYQPNAFINAAMAEAIGRRLDETSVFGSLVRAETKAADFQKNGIALSISREMALDFGLVEPTAEEKAEREESSRKWRARRAKARPVTIAYADALDAITDEPTRAVLDLHRPDRRRDHPNCEGCDFAGYEGEPPEWPCRTVDAIAAHYGLTRPDLIVFEEPARD